MFCDLTSKASNTQSITSDDISEDTVKTSNKNISPNSKVDLLIANACLKYAQSNNVACATEGQLIGLSAGQQSRVHSVKLACSKSLLWISRHSNVGLEKVAELLSQKNSFQDVINLSTNYMEDNLQPNLDFSVSLGMLIPFQIFFLKKNVASDAFFPFSDSIIEASKIGVNYITQTGGSIRDDDVVEECNKRNIVMFFTGKRIFTH